MGQIDRSRRRRGCAGALRHKICTASLDNAPLIDGSMKKAPLLRHVARRGDHGQSWHYPSRATPHSYYPASAPCEISETEQLSSSLNHWAVSLHEFHMSSQSSGDTRRMTSSGASPTQHLVNFRTLTPGRSAPAGLRKDAEDLDLPIAVGLLLGSSALGPPTPARAPAPPGTPGGSRGQGPKSWLAGSRATAESRGSDNRFARSIRKSTRKQDPRRFPGVARSCGRLSLEGCALALWQFGERFRAAGGIRRDEEVSRAYAARPEGRAKQRDSWMGRDDRTDRGKSREWRAWPDRTGAWLPLVLS